MNKSYVQEIIDYIEDHIYDNITITDISNYIGYSQFYLNKVFSIFTGMSIMYYAKKRKLEYSLSDLNTKESIVDIAFKYGFNSRRAYSRLFTSFYGKSPSHYRNNKVSLKPKIILKEIGGIIMLPYLSEETVTSLDKLYVLAQRVISKNPEDEVIKLQQDYKNKHNLNTIKELGFDIPVSIEEQNKGIRGYEYWLCISKEEYEKIQDGVPKKLEVSSSKYVTLTIDDPFANPFERIPNGWKKLVSIIKDKYEVNDTLPTWGYEEVIEVNGNTQMIIYIPIK